ncbi:MAG TPA: hypothetical protein VMR54_06385 [Thermoanaerobaculia bacterium]|nr:hypothetical protein [Thermoanaerobaculia bacterium]
MKKNRFTSRALIALLLSSGAVIENGQTITELTISAGSSPASIVAGKDGNLWFTESRNDKIGRISPSGVITEFPIPTPNSSPGGIAAGADGNLWFTESQSNKIGRISLSGVVTEFPIPTLFSSPRGIAAGTDGNLWFRETGRQIWKITTSGVFTEFPIPTPPTADSALDIAAGPDDNLWFTFSAGWIGRITTAGVVTLFMTPSRSAVQGIAAGPDGNMWFTETAGARGRISRISTDGVITVVGYLGILPFGLPRGIAAGPDGNLWFTNQTGDRIGRATTKGVITEFAIPTFGSRPSSITAGRDGNLWFTESASDKIGRITTEGEVSEFALPPVGFGPCVPNSLCLSSGRFQATATYRNQLDSGTAKAEAISDSSGFFVFDNPDSVELVVKVLNGCGFTIPNFWVFAAGLTDQETTLTVTDRMTGAIRTYFNPLGNTFVTVTDTAAFSTCR